MSGMTRFEVWNRLGRMQVVEPMLDAASLEFEEFRWRNGEPDPHGRPWHVSMHASAAPVGDRWCPRKLIYGLADFPENEPFSPMLRGTMTVGSAVEHDMVERLGFAGRLLSAPLESKVQTSFEDADIWLTGSPDLVVLPYRWNRPHILEAKTKDHDVVAEMKAGYRKWDDDHALQLQAYIGLGAAVSKMLWPSAVVCKHTWRVAEPGLEKVIDAMVCKDHGIHADSGCLIEIDLEPLQTGSLFYNSRDRPNAPGKKIEYFFDFNEAAYERARRRLAEVRAHFEAGTIPPHPFGGKGWSEQPCRFCPMKRETCKPDHKAGVTRLEESNGIEWAKQVRGGYSLDVVRDRIAKEWEGKSGVSGRLNDEHTDTGRKFT
jgi:hypothetical protein